MLYAILQTIFFLIKTPVAMQKSSPTITANALQGPIPAGDAATPKLLAKPAPTIMPITKTPASMLPSPERNSCRPGQPPARAYARPERPFQESSTSDLCVQ